MLGVLTKDLTALNEGGFISEDDPTLYSFSKIIVLQQMMADWNQYAYHTFVVKKDPGKK